MKIIDKTAMLKVLWFSNTPASGSEYLKIKNAGLSGGWLSALDKILSKYVELHIAFYYPKYVEEFEYNTVHYHPICSKNYKWNFIKNKLIGDYIDLSDLEKYIALVEKIKPNIIHIHGTENPFGALINNINVPIVMSIQGNITICYQKFLSGIERSDLSFSILKLNSFLDFPYYESFSSSYYSYKKKRTREIRNMKDCKYILGRTNWDKRISRVLSPKSDYFHVDEILNDVFYHAKWKLPKNEQLVLHTTTGNSPFKGFETICQALNLLNQLKIDVVWRVAGISENDLIVKLVKKKLKSEYPSSGLILLGRLAGDELLKSLLESSFYIMPSHIENSPNSLCEAMLIGMPCIATFAGGTGSLLTDGIDGILIQDGDPWAMTGAILELVNNKELAIQYGLKAIERAKKRHDKTKITKELLNVYNKIIEINN